MISIESSADLWTDDWKLPQGVERLEFREGEQDYGVPLILGLTFEEPTKHCMHHRHLENFLIGLVKLSI